MFCHDCGRDDRVEPGDGLTIGEIRAMCRTYRCAQCSRTPEQVQADFDAAARRESHKSAHDWSRLGAYASMRPS